MSAFIAEKFSNNLLKITEKHMTTYKKFLFVNKMITYLVAYFILHISMKTIR